MSPFVNLYLKGGNWPKRVENPSAAGWKSLPKWRIFLIWVENPRSACLKSLPKRREIGKRVEIPDNVKGKKDTERRIQRKFNAYY